MIKLLVDCVWLPGVAELSRQQIATAALFLASKVEESTRKLKDVAGVCYVKYTSDTSLKV